MHQITLPYPPTINTYWRRVGNKTLISRKGRQFRQAVQAILSAERIRPMGGRLDVLVDLYPPDRRKRDIDNNLKALLDALEKGGAYHDDSQIDGLSVERRDVRKGGLCVVEIREREGEQ